MQGVEGSEGEHCVVGRLVLARFPVPDGLGSHVELFGYDLLRELRVVPGGSQSFSESGESCLLGGVCDVSVTRVHN